MGEGRAGEGRGVKPKERGIKIFSEQNESDDKIPTRSVQGRQGLRGGRPRRG